MASYFTRAKAKVKKVVENVGSYVSKPLDYIENKMKEQDAAIKTRDDKIKTENWGSPEAYEKQRQEQIALEKKRAEEKAKGTKPKSYIMGR